MNENTTPPVRVTGQARAHPAIRRLARVCIALVLWQKSQNQTPTTEDAATQGDQSKDVQERADHD